MRRGQSQRVPIHCFSRCFVLLVTWTAVMHPVTGFVPTTTRKLESTTNSARRFALQKTQGNLNTVGELSTPGETNFVAPDYLITDSLELLDRPTLQSFLLADVKNVLGVTLTVVGLLLSTLNIFGRFGQSYMEVENLSFLFGVAIVALDVNLIFQMMRRDDNGTFSPDETISPNQRCGIIDDATVHIYAATYTFAATWWSLRTSMSCPAFVGELDRLLGPLSFSIFVFSLAAPLLTLMHHYTGYQSKVLDRTLRAGVGLARGGVTVGELPQLSELEVFRATSLLVIGMIACTYAPGTFTMTVRGQDWWSRVMELHPGQPWIESTTALFGVYATQASMIAHRAGKRGVATYAQIVPIFTLLCLALTVLPTISSVYWLSDQISLFSFYAE